MRCCFLFSSTMACKTALSLRTWRKRCRRHRGRVFDVVAEGLGDLGRLLARYHHLLAIGDLGALADVQQFGGSSSRLN